MSTEYNHLKTAKGIIHQQETHFGECLDAEITTEEESDYEYDGQDKEFAYQCDFQKKSLPNKPCTQQSLLSTLLSCNRLPQQDQDSSLTKPPARDIEDPLSGSLKRNLEREHRQYALRKHQDIIEKTQEDSSNIDSFCRW